MQRGRRSHAPQSTSMHFQMPRVSPFHVTPIRLNRGGCLLQKNNFVLRPFVGQHEDPVANDQQKE
jgi:hypothetical protein